MSFLVSVPCWYRSYWRFFFFEKCHFNKEIRVDSPNNRKFTHFKNKFRQNCAVFIVNTLLMVLNDFKKLEGNSFGTWFFIEV